MRERLREWWSRVSPIQRAQRDHAERARLLDAIDLPTADRVAALLLRSGALIEYASEPVSEHDIDPYTRAFVRQNAGCCLDQSGFAVFREDEIPPMKGDPPRTTVGCTYGLDELVVRGGERRIWLPGGETASAQSIAHCLVGHELSTTELAALVKNPTSWEPDPREHPGPTRPPVLPPPLTLALRPRSWAPVVLGMVMLGIRTVLTHAPLGFRMLCPLLIALPLFYFSLARCFEVFWLEPRARRLTIDELGLTHPRTGKRVAWESVQAIDRRWLGFALTLSDQLVVRVPRSLFVDGYRAETHLRHRIAKLDGGPYRR